MLDGAKLSQTSQFERLRGRDVQKKQKKTKPNKKHKNKKTQKK